MDFQNFQTTKGVPFDIYQIEKNLLGGTFPNFSGLIGKQNSHSPFSPLNFFQNFLDFQNLSDFSNTSKNPLYLYYGYV